MYTIWFFYPCPFCGEEQEVSIGCNEYERRVSTCPDCGYDYAIGADEDGHHLEPADPYAFSEFDAIAEYFQRKGVA